MDRKWTPPTFGEVLAKVALQPESCTRPVFVSLSPDVEFSGGEFSERTSLVGSFPLRWNAQVAKRFHAHAAIVAAPSKAAATRLIIGRSTRSAYQIAHESISARHAELIVDDAGEYRIADLDSRNGTQVEGNPVASGSSVPVHSNTLVAFGAVQFYVIEPALVQTLAKMTNPGA